MLLRSSLIGTILVLLSLPSLYSQNAEPAPETSLPTFQSKVRVVPIDVVVTNSKGEPVTGLKKEDFQIFEQGHPQTIASFQEYSGAPIAASNLQTLPPNVFTNRAQTPPGATVTIFLLDSLNTPLQNQLFVHQQVVKYFHNMKPGMPIAILKLSSRLRLLQSFTTDYHVIQAVLDDKKMGTWPEVSPWLRGPADWAMEGKNLAQLQGMGASSNSVAATRQFQADSAASQVDIRVQNTFDAFQQLASYLAAIPGRKNLIWFSRSFPLAILPSGSAGGNFDIVRDYNTRLQKTASLLTKAQVAIYPIGAEGLRAPGSDDSIDDPALHDPAVNSAISDIISDDAIHLTMDTIAEQTGGRAAYNTNGMTEAIDHAIQHGSHYYTLSYAPSNKKADGAFRSIRVKIGEEKYKLDYRRGYYADDAKTLKVEAERSKHNPLDPLMARGLPSSTQITYEIFVQPADHQPSSPKDHAGENNSLRGSVTRYTALIRIAGQDLQLETAQDGTRHGKIEMAIVAYDREGVPLNWVTKSVQIDTKLVSGAETKDIAFMQDIDVPQGDIYLRSGIYDPVAKKAGTVEVPLNAVTIAKRN